MSNSIDLRPITDPIEHIRLIEAIVWLVEIHGGEAGTPAVPHGSCLWEDIQNVKARLAAWEAYLAAKEQQRRQAWEDYKRISEEIRAQEEAEG